MIWFVFFGLSLMLCIAVSRCLILFSIFLSEGCGSRSHSMYKLLSTTHCTEFHTVQPYTVWREVVLSVCLRAAAKRALVGALQPARDALLASGERWTHVLSGPFSKGEK